MKRKSLALAMIAILLVCIMLLTPNKQQEQSASFSLTPEGILENLSNNTSLLIKCTNQNEDLIYTIVDNSILIDALNVTTWDTSYITKLADISVVIRIAEGYEIAIDQNGRVLVFDEYTDNAPGKAFYDSMLSTQHLVNWIQENAEPVDSPWGAFIN